MHTSNIVNWYRNRSSKTTSSYILLFEHGRRLNSTVSNHANNRKFGRMLRWCWKYLFHMQSEHEGVEIAISIFEFQTYSIDSGIDQRKPHYRTSRCLGTAGDWIRQYQIMLNYRKSAKLPHIEHIARKTANHLIPTTYGLQYNCGKFMLEYVSNNISFKFQQGA